LIRFGQAEFRAVGVDEQGLYDEPAKVIAVRLHDLDAVIGDEPAEVDKGSRPTWSV
jgi:hypothetical protein